MAAHRNLSPEAVVQIYLPQPAERRNSQPSYCRGGIFQETTFAIATAITEAGTNIAEAMKVTWSLMTANPLLTFFLGVSIVSIGFRFFRKAKRAVH